MKKIFTGFLLLFSVLGISQKTLTTINDVINSTNIVEISQYIRLYPSDPAVPMLKKRIVALANGEIEITKAKPIVLINEDVQDFIRENSETVSLPDSYASENASKSSYKSSGKTSASKSAYAKRPSAESETAEVLTRLLNGSPPNGTDAVALFKNNALCAVTLTILGRKSRIVEIPARGTKGVILDKGAYQLKGKICARDYTGRIDLQGDASIDLE